MARREGLPDVPETERLRVEAVYRRYRSDARKQRAWRADNPGNVAIRRELVGAVLEASPPTPGARWLDVGCGAGWLLAALAGRGLELYGVDIQQERVAACQARCSGVTARCADARALPWARPEFDVLTMLNLLSSLGDASAQRAALAEARRVLRPGGALVVWELRWPNPRNPDAHRVPASLLRAVLGPPAHSRTITGLPPLARRLGRAAPRLYPILGAIGALRTHRLSIFVPS